MEIENKNIQIYSFYENFLLYYNACLFILLIKKNNNVYNENNIIKNYESILIYKCTMKRSAIFITIHF